MIGGTAGRPVTGISQAYPDRVEVRGRDLCGDLMGRLSFTEYFHLLLTGREPTEEQRFFLDLLLVAIAEHGMMPTNVAARMTLAADPWRAPGRGRRGDPRRGPGRARHVRGVRAAARGCERARRGRGEPEDVVADVARTARRRAARCPASAIRCTGRSTRAPSGSSSSPTSAASAAPHVLLARCLGDAVAAVWGKPLPMNVSMPIAAVMLDLGYAVSTVKAVPILARTAGLLAHLAEEQENPLGFLMAGEGRGGDRLRAALRSTDARTGGREPPVGRAARARRRELPRAARVPARALAVLPREARPRASRCRRGRARRDRAAPADREAAS